MSNQGKNIIENYILIFLILVVSYLSLDKMGCFKENFQQEKMRKFSKETEKELIYLPSKEDNMNKYCKDIDRLVEKCNKSKNNDIKTLCNFSYIEVQRCRVYRNNK